MERLLTQDLTNLSDKIEDPKAQEVDGQQQQQQTPRVHQGLDQTADEDSYESVVVVAEGQGEECLMVEPEFEATYVVSTQKGEEVSNTTSNLLHDVRILPSMADINKRRIMAHLLLLPGISDPNYEVEDLIETWWKDLKQIHHNSPLSEVSVGRDLPTIPLGFWLKWLDVLESTRRLMDIIIENGRNPSVSCEDDVPLIVDGVNRALAEMASCDHLLPSRSRPPSPSRSPSITHTSPEGSDQVNDYSPDTVDAQSQEPRPNDTAPNSSSNSQPLLVDPEPRVDDLVLYEGESLECESKVLLTEGDVSPPELSIPHPEGMSISTPVDSHIEGDNIEDIVPIHDTKSNPDNLDVASTTTSSNSRTPIVNSHSEQEGDSNESGEGDAPPVHICTGTNPDAVGESSTGPPSLPPLQREVGGDDDDDEDSTGSVVIQHVYADGQEYHGEDGSEDTLVREMKSARVSSCDNSNPSATAQSHLDKKISSKTDGQRKGREAVDKNEDLRDLLQTRIDQSRNYKGSSSATARGRRSHDDRRPLNREQFRHPHRDHYHQSLRPRDRSEDYDRESKRRREREWDYNRDRDRERERDVYRGHPEYNRPPPVGSYPEYHRKRDNPGRGRRELSPPRREYPRAPPLGKDKRGGIRSLSDARSNPHIHTSSSTPHRQQPVTPIQQQQQQQQQQQHNMGDVREGEFNFFDPQNLQTEFRQFLSAKFGTQFPQRVQQASTSTSTSTSLFPSPPRQSPQTQQQHWSTSQQDDNNNNRPEPRMPANATPEERKEHQREVKEWEARKFEEYRRELEREKSFFQEREDQEKRNSLAGPGEKDGSSPFNRQSVPITIVPKTGENPHIPHDLGYKRKSEDTSGNLHVQPNPQSTRSLMPNSFNPNINANLEVQGRIQRDRIVSSQFNLSTAFSGGPHHHPPPPPPPPPAKRQRIDPTSNLTHNGIVGQTDPDRIPIGDFKIMVSNESPTRKVTTVSATTFAPQENHNYRGGRGSYQPRRGRGGPRGGKTRGRGRGNRGNEYSYNRELSSEM